jgi:hypothetical protein
LESPNPTEVPVAPSAPAAILSPWQRAWAVFARPAAAWSGLEARPQFWFPLIVLIVVTAAFSSLLYERAILPMQLEAWEEMVENGQMSAEQLDRMEASMRGPTGMLLTVVPQAIFSPVILAFSALLIWVGVSFMLGVKLRYRLAFEVAAWGSLVALPGQILTGILAWSKGSMRGVHVGFGALLPASDNPSRWITGLGIVLDAIGPLSLWWLAVTVIGAATLSGAPRRSVAWVLGGIYVAVVVFMAAVASLMMPGG